MPADSNNNQNNPNPQPPQAPQQPSFGVNQPLGQISSSDAPPLPPGVNPMSDASSPQPDRTFGDIGLSSYQPHGMTAQPVQQPVTVNQNLGGDTTPSVGTQPAGSGAAPEPVGQPTMEPGVVKPPRNFPIKKVGIIAAILFVVLLLIFAVIRFVIPLFQSEGGISTIKETEIVWWGLWEDQTIVAPVINAYQEANPGVRITYVPQSKENYRERLASAFARGEGPDIFRFHNTWVPMFHPELATVPDTILNRQQFSQRYYPVMSRDLMMTKGIVGIPLEYDGLGLYVNDEIFTNFGMTPPTTWNEFEELAIELTVRDANGVIQQSGAALGLSENVDHWQEIFALIMLQNGVDLSDPAELTSERAAQALEFYTDFAGQNGTWDETLPSSTIAFSSGKVAMILAPSWRVFEIQQQNPDLQFRVLSVPQIPSEDGGTASGMTYASYWVEGVAEDSREKALAWDFLNYLSQPETLQTFYQSASQIRLFGEPYPRQDMQDLLIDAPKVGGFIELAPQAQSWYLASRTWDGETGINTSLSQYFEDAINGMTVRNNSGNAENLMQTVSAGVQQVLVRYGLVAPAPATTEE